MRLIDCRTKTELSRMNKENRQVRGHAHMDRDIRRSKGATFVVRRLPSPAATSDMETCR